MATIIDQLKYRYKNGDVLVKLLFINIAVFLILKVIGIIFLLFDIKAVDLITFLGVPSELSQLLNRFWTLFSYMFVHEQFWHLLFNMLWLYWFGRIFLQYFSGRTLGSLYILGGFAGAFLYVFAFNTIPYFVGMGHSWMIGASAAVMAIVMGASFYRPNVKLNLLLLGQVKIVYIAIGVFLIDFLSLGSGINEGGHVAHIGGTIAGYIFAWQYRNGHDITGWVSKILDGLANLAKPRRKKPKMNVEYRRRETDMEYNERKYSEQAEIDAILDKLKKSGYSNLSPEEKKKLFDASKK
ncbi:MAG TPA: rhomboid family intramembrane serine protease [Petrimonas sp.]|uniref:rhomboid family intramembrane serine protease n=1 Tax=Petrimonas sp. TaxID=2023866 RepID=UPI001756677D|nr:rhomboid family intramembrane serine protease [Petrimonas sp.]MEA5046137.1 rhomboid family intramembrane serine protease [Petrimonas sp.]HHV85815.1 rhomboid family intramembrane serine protease [Petrimonas sp.]